MELNLLIRSMTYVIDADTYKWLISKSNNDINNMNILPSFRKIFSFFKFIKNIKNIYNLFFNTLLSTNKV